MARPARTKTKTKESARPAARVGYARAPSGGSLDAQLDVLRDAGCREAIVTDEASSATGSRPGWEELLVSLRSGDTLVVPELSRMARSVPHLLEVVGELEQRGIVLVSLRENVDTAAATGRLFLSAVRAMAQVERELRAERASLGRAPTRARGRAGGRPRTATAMLEQARRLYEGGLSASEAAKQAGIGRRTLFDYLAKRRHEAERTASPTRAAKRSSASALPTSGAPAKTASAPPARATRASSAPAVSAPPLPQSVPRPPRVEPPPDPRTEPAPMEPDPIQVGSPIEASALAFARLHVRLARFEETTDARYWRNYVVERLDRGWEVVEYTDSTSAPVAIAGGRYGKFVADQEVRESVARAIGQVRSLREVRLLLAAEPVERSFFAEGRQDMSAKLAMLGSELYGWRHFTVRATRGEWAIHAWWSGEEPVDVVRHVRRAGVLPREGEAGATLVATVPSLREARWQLTALLWQEPIRATLNRIDRRLLELRFDLGRSPA